MRLIRAILIVLSLLLINSCEEPDDIEVLKGDSETQSLIKKKNETIVKQVFSDEEIFDQYFCVIKEDMKTIMKKLDDCEND